MNDMRNNMVELQLAKRGITNQNVLESMRIVPRHLFVPLAKQPYAYLDTPLQIGEQQTISQPYMVALMIQALEPMSSDKVLEIGTGSGYSAAVLSRIVEVIHTLERLESLAEEAQSRFENLGYNNIHSHICDGTKGWPDAMPYDSIIVAAGGPEIPKSLKDQLKVGGRLVIPVGENQQEQVLMRITRETDDSFTEEKLTRVRFVPLIGEEGWGL